MAIMHPTSIPESKPGSEIKFFRACRDQLSDKYHVFYSLRWYTTRDGLREDSECDFLIFNPDYGFLCVEVKGGTGITVDGDKWHLDDYDGGRLLKESPYKQAEKSMRYFKDYYEEELEMRFPGIYGCAAAFPNYVVLSPITPESPLEITMDSRSLDNLQKRIVEIFRYFGGKHVGSTSFFAPDSQKKFIEIVNKRIALSICAGALIQDKERELLEINRTQDTVIDLLSHYPKAFIIGGAGTGKTWIGLKKVKRCLLSGGHALYMCSNRTLAETFGRMISSDKADCLTVDMLAEKILGDRASTAPVHNGMREYSSLFGNVLENQKYDLVVVDEAQDFSEDWAFCANLVLKDTGSLYVFYDENQNIYNRSFGDKFFIDTPPFVLRYNIRNTANIYKCTQETTSLGLDTVANQVEGVEPDRRKFTRSTQVVAFIDSVINKLVNREGVMPEKIVVLCNVSKSDSVLSNIDTLGGHPLSTSLLDENTICYKTVEDFKGLESDIVIFINHTYKNEPQNAMKKAMLYTAMTRARFYLYSIDYEQKV